MTSVDATGADVLMRRLEESIVRRGGVIVRGTKVVSLVVEGETCSGVEVLRHHQLTCISANAVIIADGGFAANREMIAKYIELRGRPPDPFHTIENAAATVELPLTRPAGGVYDALHGRKTTRGSSAGCRRG